MPPSVVGRAFNNLTVLTIISISLMVEQSHIQKLCEVLGECQVAASELLPISYDISVIYVHGITRHPKP